MSQPRRDPVSYVAGGIVALLLGFLFAAVFPEVGAGVAGLVGVLLIIAGGVSSLVGIIGLGVRLGLDGRTEASSLHDGETPSSIDNR